ncbi:MAG: transglutaminaseTgpA domain-containing protein, partial [Nocardioidaceae bacterium]
MTTRFGEQHKLALLGLAAVMAMSLSFVPALTDKQFLLIGALVATSVVVLGAVLRQLRVPSLAVLLAQSLLLVGMLALGYGTRLAFYILPTKATFRQVADLVDAGFQVAAEYAAPAPRNAGLTLMVVFLIGLVAILVDFFAVGLGRIPLAGLPLLALYTVPVVALPKGIPAYAFVPGAVGFIAMLMTAERDRVVHWGRNVSSDFQRRSGQPAVVVDTSSLAAAGRKVSFLALSAAVLLPFVIPAFAPSLLDGNRNPGTGSGTGPGSQLSFDDPMVSLANSLHRDEPVDLLQVSSVDTPEYLRLAVLDEPGPDAWRGGPINSEDTVPLDETLPPPVGLDASVRTEQRGMSISPTSQFPSDSLWLPVPFASSFVDAGGDWRYLPRDLTVTGKLGGGSYARYDVVYNLVEPTPSQLASSAPVPDEVAGRYGDVPADVPSVVGTTARTVVADAANNYEAALLLQDFFRHTGNFEYDLDTGYGYGYDALAAFLKERRGFCQHFAATMAMMAREVGIPSRVVVGFLRAESRDASGDAVFTSDNVHSWPELYFDRIGWVRFEPTPGLGAPLPEYAPRPATQQPGEQVPSRAPSTNVDEAPRPLPDETNNSAAAPGSSGSDSGSGGASLLSTPGLIAVVVLGLLALPALLRWAIRRRRMNGTAEEFEAAEAAWLELRDHMTDLGMPWTGSMTPRARERAVGSLLRADGESMA